MHKNWKQNGYNGAIYKKGGDIMKKTIIFCKKYIFII